MSRYHAAMPELPEVETVRRGLEGELPGRLIVAVTVGDQRLRLPWPEGLAARLIGCRFGAIRRRAKYLLLELTTPSARRAALLWHLGMSGCIRLLDDPSAPLSHRHLLLTLDDGRALAYTDPRRFGLVDLIAHPPWSAHRLLCGLGPEPLGRAFDGDYLARAVCHRRSTIKSLLLNGHIVAGIGNIYACEALFDAGIAPFRRANRLDGRDCARLVAAIRSVLRRAIKAGGSTIRDFAGSDGRPGYFAHQFRCYGREGEPCARCQTAITRVVQQGRSSFYCPVCQPD